MIQLTRLNNQQFAVNSDLIKFIEKAPDTVLTLTTGEKIVVLETPQVVIDKIVEFRRALIAGMPSAAALHQSLLHSKSSDSNTQPPEATALG